MKHSNVNKKLKKQKKEAYNKTSLVTKNLRIYQQYVRFVLLGF